MTCHGGNKHVTKKCRKRQSKIKTPLNQSFLTRLLFSPMSNTVYPLNRSMTNYEAIPFTPLLLLGKRYRSDTSFTCFSNKECDFFLEHKYSYMIARFFESGVSPDLRWILSQILHVKN